MKPTALNKFAIAIGFSAINFVCFGVAQAMESPEQIANQIAIDSKAKVAAAQQKFDINSIVEKSKEFADKSKKDSEEVVQQAMANTNATVNQDHIKQVFGLTSNLPTNSAVAQNNKDTSTLDIYVSLSMPERALKEAMEMAIENDMRVNFVGLVKGTKMIPQTIKFLHEFVKKQGLSRIPKIQLNPNGFLQSGVTSVPCVTSRSGKLKGLHKICGSLNMDYMRDKIKTSDADGILVDEKVGIVYPIKEINLIDDMKQRMKTINWDEKKQRAIDGYWTKKAYTKLPTADRDESWSIDPTVRVVKDIRDNKGQVVMSKGEVVNPLVTNPMRLRMYVINPTRSEEVQFVKDMREKKPFSGNSMILVTEFDNTQGWKGLENLTKELEARIFEAPKEVSERFHLTGTPAIIETENVSFRVHQYKLNGLTQGSNNE